MSKETHVYFIRPADFGGPVKIGYSTWTEGRLQALMVWSPYPLRVVAKTPGDAKLERRFHALFEEHHSHSEWFHPAPTIDRAIEQINDGTFDFGQLPSGRLVGRMARPPWSQAQREAHSLSHLLRHRCWNHGLRPPPELAERVEAFRGLSDQERAEITADVHAFIADPTVNGVVIDAPWARKKYAALLAKREAA